MAGKRRELGYDSQNHTAQWACRVAAIFAMIREVGNHANSTWTVKVKSTTLELWSSIWRLPRASIASACKLSDLALRQYHLCPYLLAARDKIRSPLLHPHLPNLEVWIKDLTFSVWSISHLHLKLPVNLGNTDFSFPDFVVLKNSLKNRENGYFAPDWSCLPCLWD